MDATFSMLEPNKSTAYVHTQTFNFLPKCFNKPFKLRSDCAIPFIEKKTAVDILELTLLSHLAKEF